MSKFYTYDQNNSGGFFVIDDQIGVSEYVIIEADDTQSANDRLHEIGKRVDGFWDFCECCGERWSLFWDDEEDEGKPEPMIFGKPIASIEQGLFRHRAFVHYLDGTIKEFVFKEKENNDK